MVSAGKGKVPPPDFCRPGAFRSTRSLCSPGRFALREHEIRGRIGMEFAAGDRVQPLELFGETVSEKNSPTLPASWIASMLTTVRPSLLFARLLQRKPSFRSAT